MNAHPATNGPAMRTALTLSFALLATCAASAAPSTNAAVEAQLCRWQVEALVSRDKLTAEERTRFEKQCDCLEDLPEDGDRALCTSEWEDQ